MLPKAERLTRKEIDLLSNGKSVFGTLLSIRFLPITGSVANPKAVSSKFSVSVSKKVAPRAVDRNLIRRRIYSAIKKAGLNKTLNKKSFVMIIPKKNCINCPIEDISTELQTLFKKATI